MSQSLSDQLDALLPQTQCTRCGYPDCRAYADAIARNEAAINRCPPGGETTLQALASVLNQPLLPLDLSRGSMPELPLVARVIEADCIGCYKCVKACPVDAIVGAPKWMHTVIAAECSGCELCLPVCPTDCIELVPREAHLPSPAALSEHWRASYQARNARLARDAERRSNERTAPLSPPAPPATPTPELPAATPPSELQTQARALDVAAAIARARLRRATPSS